MLYYKNMSPSKMIFISLLIDTVPVGSIKIPPFNSSDSLGPVLYSVVAWENYMSVELDYLRAHKLGLPLFLLELEFSMWPDLQVGLID